MLDWLNTNQGAALSLLTLVYVTTTLGMMRAMSRANALASSSLKQALDLEKARIRPFVVFYLDFERPAGTVTATLANIGATAAFDIKVTLTPTLLCLWAGTPHETTLTQRTLAFIAPNHRERDLLAVIPEFHRQYDNPVFTGEVSYADAEGRRYCEPLRFDFNYRKNIGWHHPKDPGEQIAKLHDDLRELTRAVKSMTAELSARKPNNSTEP